jgi:hypothetical protein
MHIVEVCDAFNEEFSDRMKVVFNLCRSSKLSPVVVNPSSTRAYDNTQLRIFQTA